MLNNMRKLTISLFFSIFALNSSVNADVKVVASIKPIHSLVSYVMDGVGTVSYTHLTLPTILLV